MKPILPRIIAKYSYLYSEYHWARLPILRANDAQNNKRSEFPAANGDRHASDGPWQWCDRYDKRLLPGPGRVRGGRGRPPERRSHGNQLCQRRPGFPRLCIALGGARRAAEGRQVDAAAARAAGHQDHQRHRPVPVDDADAAQLHRRPLCGEQGAHGASVRVQPRLPRRAPC
ncbi:hypothetical protein D9M68_814010 [compost metagenome]